MVAANRAFETTLKTICHERGWAFNSGDRASELVTVVRNQGLFPSYLDKGLDAHVALLRPACPECATALEVTAMNLKPHRYPNTSRHTRCT